MPRRSRAGLADVLARENLAAAVWRAAKGKRDRPDVQALLADVDAALDGLQRDVVDGRAPYGRWRVFSICDPKPRQILAPCFPDRVLHHALVACMEPRLERALVDDTYACRRGKGTLAAARRAQQHLRRYPWLVKVDVRAFFASVDHDVLLAILARRFRDPDLIDLCRAVLTRTPAGYGRGLPIGALTSQHFANTYLDGFDRWLLAQPSICGMVRYMDDVVWWCDCRADARDTLARATAWLQAHRKMALKPTARIGRSVDGVGFLGFRVLRGALRLSLRRRRRYAAARQRWERAWQSSSIDAATLQRGVDSAVAITAHADARQWRRAELRRRPAVDA